MANTTRRLSLKNNPDFLKIPFPPFTSPDERAAKQKTFALRVSPHYRRRTRLGLAVVHLSTPRRWKRKATFS
ncbi:MAG: hypothetical protein IPO41_16670 [Acidobacteria bacterium]|nr:hypothetical protein [Acidobacteriota bacterium]